MNFSPSPMTGRCALVTGSSQGIGEAIALSFARCGCRVGIHSKSERSAASKVAAAARSYGQNAPIFLEDLARRNAAQRLAKRALKQFDHIDILVLNASIDHRKPWLKITSDEVMQETQVNLASGLALIQELAPQMMQRGWGRILVIGSVQQVRPHPQLLVYAALKAAWSNAAKNLARQFAKSGVTVNVLAPGAIDTPRNYKVLADRSYRRKVLARIPCGYLGTAEDCAHAATFLCSEEARYITGTDLFVDGGLQL